jgi:DNA invertase Pin-like site-specific DNA recombinase
MRYVTYNRVSSEDQTSGTSLDWQREQQVAWGERAGWTHVEDIFDGGQSGAKLDRAGVQRTMELLRDRSVDLVSFYKVDRAARAQRVFEDLWTAIYTLGGRVFIHQKGKVYGTLDELMGDTVWDRAMAEQERYSIQSRTADGVAHHLNSGSFIFRTSYGYYVTRERRGGANVNVVQIDETQARVVRRIVAETIAGSGLADVAAGLNRDQILTRSRTAWSTSSVNNVLSKRRLYSGKAVTLSRRVRGTPISATYRMPPILGEDTLSQLEAAIHGRRRGTAVPAPLRGSVRCSHCGSVATAVRNRAHSSGRPVMTRYSLSCSSYRRRLTYRQAGRAIDFPVCEHSLSYNVVAQALLSWLDQGGYEAAVHSLALRVRAYHAIQEAKEREIARTERELEDLESRALTLPVEELGQLGRVFENHITRLLEALQALRKTAAVARSKGEAAGAALALLPNGAEDLAVAVRTSDRAQINRLLFELGLQISVDFHEPDPGARRGSVRFGLRVEAEAQ